MPGSNRPPRFPNDAQWRNAPRSSLRIFLLSRTSKQVHGKGFAKWLPPGNRTQRKPCAPIAALVLPVPHPVLSKSPRHRNEIATNDVARVNTSFFRFRVKLEQFRGIGKLFAENCRRIVPEFAEKGDKAREEDVTEGALLKKIPYLCRRRYKQGKGKLKLETR